MCGGGGGWGSCQDTGSTGGQLGRCFNSDRSIIIAQPRHRIHHGLAWQVRRRRSRSHHHRAHKFRGKLPATATGVVFVPMLKRATSLPSINAMQPS